MAKVFALAIFTIAALIFMSVGGGSADKQHLIKKSNCIAVAQLNTITALDTPNSCSATGYCYRVDGTIEQNIKGSLPKYLIMYAGKG